MAKSFEEKLRSGKYNSLTDARRAIAYVKGSKKTKQDLLQLAERWFKNGNGAPKTPPPMPPKPPQFPRVDAIMMRIRDRDELMRGLEAVNLEIGTGVGRLNLEEVDEYARRIREYRESNGKGGV